MLDFPQTVFQKRLIIVFTIWATAILIWTHAHAETGLITVDRLNLRQKPDPRAPVITQLERNTIVDILDRRDGWLEVYTGKQHGFIRHLPGYVRIQKTTPPPDLGQLKTESETLKKQLEANQKTLSALLNQEESVLSALEKNDFAIAAARQKLKQVKAEMIVVERRLKQTRQSASSLQRKITKNERYASRRLVALYKLHWIGPTNLLATAESIFDLSKRKAALEKILGNDQKTLESLQNDKIQLAALEEKLISQKQDQQAIKKTFGAQLEQLKNERQGRNLLLSQILNQKALNLAAISELRQAATALDKTIASIARQKPPDIVSPKSRLTPNKIKMPVVKPVPRPKPVEKPKKTAVAPVTPAPKPELKKPAHTKAKPASKPTPKPKPKPSPPKKPKPKLKAKPFIAYKGLLQMPVKGKIASNFGKFTNEKFNLVGFRSGIDIQSRRGEPIRAVFDGSVVYAAWFKGYGNMIIIDHGNHYYTVYAHAEDLFKTKGATVTTGEVIATVGDSGSLKGPGLYFELRHHGKPIDPLDWIKRS